VDKYLRSLTEEQIEKNDKVINSIIEKNQFKQGWLKQDVDAVIAAFEKIPYKNRQEIKDVLYPVIKKCYEARDWPEHHQHEYSGFNNEWFLWEMLEILTTASD
jgi:hypothetical protein